MIFCRIHNFIKTLIIFSKCLEGLIYNCFHNFKAKMHRLKTSQTYMYALYILSSIHMLPFVKKITI